MGLLEIRLLGEPQVLRDGVALGLPQSRKTRALLAYLAVKGGAHRRDMLCDLLWEAPDDPRASLRWSLTKLRPLLNDDDAERLGADRERVTFEPQGARVDLVEALATCAGDLFAMPLDQLEALALSFGDTPALSGLELPAQPAFESWRLGVQEAVRQAHARTLDTLTQRCGDARAVALLRKRVALDPADADAHARLIAALRRHGAPMEAERQLDVSRRALAAFGEVDERALAGALRPAPAASPVLRQEIRFCTAADGVRIAYASVGAGPPLLKTANWLNHLEYDWESPVWRWVFHELAQTHTLIRYDERGNGLSDWRASDLSLEAFTRDFEAVVEASGLKRFPVLAVSQGCCPAIEYAVRNPDRVSGLVLFNGFARGWRVAGGAKLLAHTHAMRTLMLQGWGEDTPAFRQMFTSLFLPNGTPEQFAWFNHLQRNTTSPEIAVRLLDAFGDLDVRRKLGEVRAPTLVLHSRLDRFVPMKLGQDMAAGIPGARFVGLDSENHILLQHEPAAAHFLAEVRAFLAALD